MRRNLRPTESWNVGHDTQLDLTLYSNLPPIQYSCTFREPVPAPVKPATNLRYKHARHDMHHHQLGEEPGPSFHHGPRPLEFFDYGEEKR